MSLNKSVELAQRRAATRLVPPGTLSLNPDPGPIYPISPGLQFNPSFFPGFLEESRQLADPAPAS